ncbi:MAG: protein kinase domain-containing protein [Candidatus Acidiferrales bacterium]
MLCPYCRAENSDSSLRCTRCGNAFPVVDDAVTMAGGAASPSAAPSQQRPATASGVMTPPPGSVPGAAGTSWPTYIGRFSQLEPGTEFGPRYRIESMIGEGGMGTVYKAYDRDLDRLVALKLLRAELTADSDAMRRFKQELLLASKISHKNILRIHDLGDAGGVKFISMAFVDGEDLHAVLKREGQLSLDRTLAITRQLCGALEAAHSEGVVHRDLKPHNVMLDKSGTVFISDFGLAKSLEAGAIGMTRTGEYLGTPRYMAPEQVEAKPVDHRTDLYSLGLIVYEMATGDVPFTGQTTLQLMYQRVKEKPKNPKELNPELPDYLVGIIMRCLETHPERRYQSAADILRDLDAERAQSRSRSVQIVLPGPAEKPWFWAVGGVVLLALLSLAVPAVRHRIFGAPQGTTHTAIPADAKQRYLAVLPFRVIGEESQLSYIAQGLVEGLSAKLFQLNDVRVASSSATAEAMSKGSLDKIARTLGVSLLVHGQVQAAGEQIRIIVNLESLGESAERLWSQDFTGVPKDLLTLEDEIYSRMVTALGLNLTTEERQRASAKPTGNIEAYDLYLRGRNAMRGQPEVKNIESAIDFYRQALAEDAGFALAYTGMADANLAMYREKKDNIWAERALQAAQQARDLNDNLAEVHFALGTVYSATGRTSQAVTELNRALKLSPNSDEGQRRLGLAYLRDGKPNDAALAFRKGIEINPYFWANHNLLGEAFTTLGDHERALASFRRVTELEPDNPVGYQNMAAVYTGLGRNDEAIATLQLALQRQPHPSIYSNLGTTYFFMKRYDESVKMFEKAVELSPNDELLVGNLADAYRASGLNDKALAAYNKAIELAFNALQVNPRNTATLGSLALYYSKVGQSVQATEYIRRARTIDEKNVGLIYIEATVHAQAGRPARALASLREAFRNNYGVQLAPNDPELSSLHTLPEFQELIREFSKQ